MTDEAPRERWGRHGIDDPLKTIPPSRHPFQFFVMFALALTGITVVFRDATPGSINDLVAPWAARLWGMTMFVGGTMALVSAFWRDRVTGLLMERIALAAIAGVCGVYALAVIYAFRGANGILNSSLVIAISVACLWRMWHVQRELNRLIHFIAISRGGKPDA